MQEPAIARALGGRVWSYTAGSVALLGMTGMFATLVDAGWTLLQALLGAVLAACGLWLSGVLVQHRWQPGRDAP